MQEVKHLERRYFGNQNGKVVEGRTIMMCLKCGALVAAAEVHIRFHEQTVDQLQGASCPDHPSDSPPSPR